MEINLSNANVLPNANATANAASVRDAAVKERSDFNQSEVAVAKNEKVDVQLTDEERYERLKRNARDYVRDMFAVSDMTFSIFKDASGQFITRTTSLRDGSVKYIPEPDMMQYMAGRQAEREALLEIRA